MFELPPPLLPLPLPLEFELPPEDDPPELELPDELPDPLDPVELELPVVVATDEPELFPMLELFPTPCPALSSFALILEC